MSDRFGSSADRGPDPAAEPAGFTVEVERADRIHFLDWGAPTATPPGRPVLAVHGLLETARMWAPIGRRLHLERRFVAPDLRGHGLSDAPTHGYDADTLAADVLAVAEGAGLLDPGGPASADGRAILAGIGAGAIVAAEAARELGAGCAGLVLVDGGWEDLATSTGLEPDEFIRAIAEPPEVLRSLAAYLADRRAFDPGTWDADQEAAARAEVVELPAGRVVSSARPHAIEGHVEAMFAYRPAETLLAVAAPIAAIVAMDPDGTRTAALEEIDRVLAGAGHRPMSIAHYPQVGHNLLRHRPDAVVAAIRAFD